MAKPKALVYVETTLIDTAKYKPYYASHVKFKGKLEIRNAIPWTEKQKELIELIENKETRAVFVDGPAGTSKTLSSIFASLEMLRDKKIGKIYYCRSAVESSTKSLGFLPGTHLQKMENYLLPLEDKLTELLDAGTITNLKTALHIEGFAVNYARGRNLYDCILIVDECQNMEFMEIQTLMTRLSNHAKVIFLADHSQCDLKYNKNDASSIFKLFSDEESASFGIRKFTFTEEDIVRSEFCKFVVKKFATLKKDS